MRIYHMSGRRAQLTFKCYELVTLVCVTPHFYYMEEPHEPIVMLIMPGQFFCYPTDCASNGI